MGTSFTGTPQTWDHAGHDSSSTCRHYTTCRLHTDSCRQRRACWHGSTTVAAAAAAMRCLENALFTCLPLFGLPSVALWLPPSWAAAPLPPPHCLPARHSRLPSPPHAFALQCLSTTFYPTLHQPWRVHRCWPSRQHSPPAVRTRKHAFRLLNADHHACRRLRTRRRTPTGTTVRARAAGSRR